MITDELISIAKYHYDKGDSFPYHVILTAEMADEFTEIVKIDVAIWPEYTLYGTPYGELKLSTYFPKFLKE